MAPRPRRFRTVARRTDADDRPAKPGLAQRQPEGAADQPDADNRDGFHLDASRPTAGAMIRNCCINSANCSGPSDCAPSLSAWSGIMVHFDRAGRRRPPRPRPAPSAATLSRRPVPCEGSADHRQVRELLHHRDRGDVHGVAGVGFERADAALAQDHVVVAAGQDVLGRKQQFFDGGGDAALQQHRLALVGPVRAAG